MALGYHHWRQYKTTKSKTGNGLHGKAVKDWLDKFIYIAAFTSVAMYIPQIIKIWSEQNISGVSIWTWSAFLASSIFWVFYGFVHNSKSIMVLNGAVAIAQMAIVIGILNH